MEYEVLKGLIYNGKVYNQGEIIEITENDVVNSCIDRNLIKEIEKEKIKEEIEDTRGTEEIEEVEETDKKKIKKNIKK